MLPRSKTKRFLLLAALTWGWCVGGNGGSASWASGPWPLNPAPLRALPVPRGHFLPRIPRAGCARAELESLLILQSPISIPSPLPPAPGRILRRGTPAPPPLGGPSLGGRGETCTGRSAEPASPAGSGLRGRGRSGGARRGNEGRRAGARALWPGRGLDLLTAIAPLGPAPSPGPSRSRS